jgi:hypothetical protein
MAKQNPTFNPLSRFFVTRMNLESRTPDSPGQSSEKRQKHGYTPHHG